MPSSKETLQPTAFRRHTMTRKYMVHVDYLLWEMLSGCFTGCAPWTHSKTFYHPWSGSHRITAKLSESDYRIKKLAGKRKIQVVHFDRLKPCDPGMRFIDMTLVSSSPLQLPLGLSCLVKTWNPVTLTILNSIPSLLLHLLMLMFPHSLHIDMLLVFVLIVIDMETMLLRTNSS